MTIATNLKTTFSAALQRSTSPQQKELVEQAATLTAQDNVEPACAFIQKTAVEKSISEIDKRLATEFDLRKHARSEGRRYYDPAVFAYQVYSYYKITGRRKFMFCALLGRSNARANSFKNERCNATASCRI